MRTRRKASISELRRTIDALPLRTREAMLEGIRENEIILGAYASDDGGVCPMLAAHRQGGRTTAEAFARTWDSFGAVRGRRARRATRRELLILTTHLEASVLAESARDPSLDLALAIAEHRRLRARSARPESRRHDPDRGARREGPRRERARAEQALAALRPGDRDRSRELGSAPGWAWSRPVRRYDDYERVLTRLATLPADSADQDRARANRERSRALTTRA